MRKARETSRFGRNYVLIYHQLRDYEPLIHALYRVASSPKGRAPRPLLRWMLPFTTGLFIFGKRTQFAHPSVVDFTAGIITSRIFVCVFSLLILASLIAWSAAEGRPLFAGLSLTCLTFAFILINLATIDRTFWSMRRLHDIGLPGGIAFVPQIGLVAFIAGLAITLRQIDARIIIWVMIGLPALGLFTLVYLAFLYNMPGQSGPNRYGPEPEPLRLPEDMDTST